MSRKTVAELDEELQEVKENFSNVQLSRGIVHNHAQLGAVIEKYSRYGELIEAKVTIEHSPGTNHYHYTIWHYPLMNQNLRRKDEYVIAGMSGHDFIPTRN